MDKNEQNIESTKRDIEIKSKEKENQTEMGYSSVLGEYKSESGKNENKEKSTVFQSLENKLNEPATSYNSGTSVYSSPKNIENKESKANIELKSNVNQLVENKPNLPPSTGYNSMEGEYISSKIENKESKEGATFAEYPQSSSVGTKTTVAHPIETKANITTTTYNSATGGYSSSSTSNNILKNSNETQTQPLITPLVVQVPSNAPVINNNIPIGNVQGSITFTSSTTTTTTTNSIGITQMQPPNIGQKMPFGQPQPLEGSTFDEYPQTVSHGIKSTNIPSVDTQPK